MLRRFFATAAKHQKSVTIREALNQAHFEEFERDKRVFLIGEEVAQFDGGYKISKGLLKKYGPERVIDTPIAEMGFTGLAVGASMMGLIPIVEFMTWNFALQSIDHIMNSSAKIRHMSGGELSSTIVFRGVNGPAAAVAATHSQCFASVYSNCPGLVVISPYDSYDNKSLLKAAIRCGQPVVFLENELMYPNEYEVPEEFYDPEHIAPIGKARIMRQGKHVTITAFSRMVGLALKAAEELAKEGIEAEVINLRTIKPLDRKAIIDSVKKTGRLVAVEDGYPSSGVTAEVISTVIESPAFDFLDAQPQRVTSYDLPLPYANSIEQFCLPQVKSIVKAVHNTMKGVKH